MKILVDKFKLAVFSAAKPLWFFFSLSQDHCRNTIWPLRLIFQKRGSLFTCCVYKVKSVKSLWKTWPLRVERNACFRKASLLRQYAEIKAKQWERYSISSNITDWICMRRAFAKPTRKNNRQNVNALMSTPMGHSHTPNLIYVSPAWLCNSDNSLTLKCLIFFPQYK